MVREETPLIVFLTVVGVFAFGGFMILGYWLINHNIILRIKTRRIKKLISRIKEGDSFWNLDEMTALGKEVHSEVMYAWKTGNFRALKHQVTPRVKIEWMSIWQSMRIHHYRFILQIMNIDNVEVVGITDHYDNDRDGFQLAISGATRRYFFNTKYKMIVSGHDNEIHNFVDILSFKRINDRWLLDHIKLDAGFIDILKIRQKDYHDFVGPEE